MKRDELAERILDIKREKAWTWKYISDEMGGVSPVLVVGALLGQMKLPKPLAEGLLPGALFVEKPYQPENIADRMNELMAA